ncbi:MAG: hypothetical protein IJP79_07260 [Paludibacteraceae bacterium]|nr:hypothetical protein [Paludibacteraceae bacterium]MBQ6963482.1 hypothetical protein [Paludibacteraceae bacterium]MBQ7662504.1 hypothetical protein [Prevotella sp.]MBQ7748271.1 hypothetical protein [Paludibacteraceae bacterium]
MATVLDCLKGINAYPVQLRTFTEVAERRGVALDDEATAEVLKGSAFNLCRADILLWLSYAPAISQGGQSYSFTDEQRTQMRNEAQQLYKELEEEQHIPKTIYGYKGSRL